MSGVAVSMESETLNGRVFRGQAGEFSFFRLPVGSYRFTISDFPPDVVFDEISKIVSLAEGAFPFVEFEGHRLVARVQTDVLILDNDDAYPVSRFRLGGPEAGCDADHWHSSEPVPILARGNRFGEYDCAVDTNRTRPDPQPRGCGHGTVAEVRRTLADLPQSCLDQYGL